MERKNDPAFETKREFAAMLVNEYLYNMKIVVIAIAFSLLALGINWLAIGSIGALLYLYAFYLKRIRHLKNKYNL
jgi:hypothetical protein